MNYLHYEEESNYTPQQAQNELMELLIKAGRRCAYDLRHATDLITDKVIHDTLQERATYWLKVFNPSNGVKDYRHHLHMVISNKNSTIDALVSRCKEHGIDVSDLTDDAIPF